MATLLPPGEQQFSDQNGAPYAGGSVLFTIPNTDTLKPTYQDPLGAILNTNPVILDAAGRAVIYGTGSYRERLYDADGNPIWDQLTASTASGTVAWGGESTGTVNGQALNASSFAEEDGQLVGFIAGLTNTSALTIAPGAGSSPIAVLKDTLNGPVPCTGGEVTTGNAVLMIYEQSRGAFHLVEIPNPPGITGALTDIAGASTINLGSVASQNANVTGSGWTATSFGSSANVNQPIYYLTFASTGTLTNSSALILPGGANISVAAGDTAIAMYLGSGNWRIVVYTVAAQTGYKYVGTQVFAASGTYTPTAGVKYIRARLWGGGGGGGGAVSSSNHSGGAGGGGEGAYTEYNATVPAAQTVTIGAAGSAGNTSGTDGGVGGVTSLGALATAPGGLGGQGSVATSAPQINANAGGAGGAPGTGTVAFAGQGGGGGLGANDAGANFGSVGGTGGGMGGGIGGSATSNGGAGSQNGSAGRNYGGGGGGAAGQDGGTATGGAGRIGLIQVDEWA